MFFFSIIVEKYFKTKLKMENEPNTIDLAMPDHSDEPQILSGVA